MDQKTEQMLDEKLAIQRDLHTDVCDSNDYLIAVFCGMVAGVVDSFFVGTPTDSVLGSKVDKIAESGVEKCADALISKDAQIYEKLKKQLESENLGKRELNQRLKEELIKHGIPENFAGKDGYVGFRGNNSKLVYLENKFRVSYDQSNSSKIKEDISFTLTPNNHHLKSIAHWPDLIGLLFAILDQFTGETTFISEGQIYRVTPKQNSLPVLRGETFAQKLFFGFVNWLGHLLSDFCGSHSSQGRGDGIPIPFFGVFMECDFGQFLCGEDSLTLADLAKEVYENGYDARFGATMAIPVLLQDLMIRFIWAIKAHFVRKMPWKECIPTNSHSSLRIMLIVGNATLCFVDGADAAIRSGGHIVDFFLHLNLIAWYKLVMMILKELLIRYDFTYEDIKLQFQRTNEALDAYLLRLRSIDYAIYEAEIADLSDIRTVLTNPNADVSALYAFLEPRTSMQFHNLEELDVNMQDPDFVLDI